VRFPTGGDDISVSSPRALGMFNLLSADYFDEVSRSGVIPEPTV
jgi:hypothetical protein